MKISKHATIQAPADVVWDVIGPQFDRIGQWATAISWSAPTSKTSTELAAPVDGRVCHTGIPILPEVSETIVAYDDGNRTLTYEATGPSFVTEARNRWTVSPVDGNRSRVSFDAELATRGLLGRAAVPVLWVQLSRTGRQLLADLAHYVENGQPSPRKQLQLSRMGPRAAERPPGISG